MEAIDKVSVSITYSRTVKDAINVSIRHEGYILHVMWKPPRKLSYAVLFSNKVFMSMLNIDKWLGLTLFGCDIIFRKDITLQELANGNVPKFSVETYGVAIRGFPMNAPTCILKYASVVMEKTLDKATKLKERKKKTLSNKGFKTLTSLYKATTNILDKLYQTSSTAKLC